MGKCHPVWIVSGAVRVAAVLSVFVLARDAAAQGQQFFSVTPCRAVDTRLPGYGGTVTASIVRTFTIKGGSCGVPADAKSVALNATVINPSVGGFILVWPNVPQAPLPLVSNMNFTAGTPALANGIVVGLYSGAPDLAMAYGSSTGSGSLDFVLDVTGYFK